MPESDLDGVYLYTDEGLFKPFTSKTVGMLVNYLPYEKREVVLNTEEDQKHWHLEKETEEDITYTFATTFQDFGLTLEKLLNKSHIRHFVQQFFQHNEKIGIKEGDKEELVAILSPVLIELAYEGTFKRTIKKVDLQKRQILSLKATPADFEFAYLGLDPNGVEEFIAKLAPWCDKQHLNPQDVLTALTQWFAAYEVSSKKDFEKQMAVIYEDQIALLIED